MIATVRVGMSTLHLHSTLAQIPVQYTSLQVKVWLTNTAKFLKASTSLSCINSGPHAIWSGPCHAIQHTDGDCLCW